MIDIVLQSIDLDNLISICTKKLRVMPQHKKALYIRSNALIKQSRFKEAIRDCDSLLAIDPQHVGAYYLRGCAHEKQKLIDQAINDFSTVLHLDPSHVNAAYAKAACINLKVYNTHTASSHPPIFYTQGDF